MAATLTIIFCCAHQRCHRLQGRFEQGSAGTELYDGAALANSGPVVVVTINYRLGVLGFYTDPSLNITGNYAIKGACHQHCGSA